jgi:two-component system, OmpR family, alkaline phosphatase synthesis response regulator PhoP
MLGHKLHPQKVFMQDINANKVDTESPAENMSKGKYNLLVASKDQEFLAQVTHSLKKGDFRITPTTKGNEVLKLTAKENPDMLVLDVEMEGLDGIEVCWEIKSDPATQALPVVFISERAEDFTQIAAYEAGADDFIIKPARSRLLIAKLNAVLRRCYEMSEPASQVKKFGIIEIDEEQVMVYKKGQPLKFSKKEFQLLLLLTSKPGKVFRRNNILAKIWGDDIIVGDRNIDTHIKKLRKKLGKDYIQTVRGIGYKFQF